MKGLEKLFQMNYKYVNTLQIIAKAHKYSFGETLLFDVKSNKAKLVLIAIDSGVAVSKKIMDKCNYYKVECIKLFDKDFFKKIFNKDISSIAIIDENLALKFKDNLIKEEINYGNSK